MLVYIVFLPLLASAVIYPLGKVFKHKVGYIASLPIFASLIGLISIGLRNYPEVRFFEVINWVETRYISVSLGFLLDGISFPISLIIALVTALSCIYSVSYLEHEEGHQAYFSYYLVYTTGMLGAVLSTNLIQFFFFWELMLVPSYMLIAGWGYGDRRRVAFKYFLYTQLGSILILLSILYIGVMLNTFEIGLLSSSSFLLTTYERILLSILFVIGFGVKMAIVPLHGWLPEAHAEAPTPISVILSGVMIEVGLYAIIRIVYPISFPVWTGSEAATILMTLALLSMIYGGIMALVQDDVKRLLAYSSISQMGYMFFGVATATATGVEGGVFHIFNHGLLKGLLFMIAGVLIHQIGIRDMRKLGGLASRMPLTAGLAIIGAMGIAGLPGISGFISEYLIFLGAFSSSSSYKYILLILATLSTAISAGYMTLFIKRVFFGPIRDELKDATDPPYSMLIPMLILGVMAVILGIYPSLILDYIIPGLGFLMR